MEDDLILQGISKGAHQSYSLSGQLIEISDIDERVLPMSDRVSTLEKQDIDERRFLLKRPERNAADEAYIPEDIEAQICPGAD
ncbi:MAG: hypothetical protein BroJett029_17900 [Alphaproteobacteria bacterium]|nr:MAG: hypothetical protein BroJett029_17900 [Alphaproteobacteria bacterium]